MVTLDLDHLKKIVGNDPAFLRQVLQIFVANAPKDVAELSRFAEAGDHEKVAFYAHKLKSASGAIGFNEAYEAFKQIEAMGKEMAPIGEIQEEAMASTCSWISAMGPISLPMASICLKAS